MRKLFLVALVAALPLAGIAEPTQPVSPGHEAMTHFGLTSDQAMIVGAGMLGGAVGLYALLGGAAWTLAGGASGALLGDWWFIQRTDTTSPRKLPVRHYVRLSA
jgi:hypothetical protein